jgi:hypothetical protein
VTCCFRHIGQIAFFSMKLFLNKIILKFQQKKTELRNRNEQQKLEDEKYKLETVIYFSNNK